MSNNEFEGGGLENEDSVSIEPADMVDREREIKKSRRDHAAKELKEWVKSIVIAMVLAMVLKSTVIASYMVPTGSMEPTIVPQDRMFGNRFVYYLRKPARGDIVSFTPPASATGSSQQETLPGRLHVPGFGVIPYLKRVIGVEGDIARVTQGRVYINGKAMSEPYIKQPPCYELPPVKVPKDEIFVLGDNRCNSHDSHIWGFLPVKNVQAKVFFRFWPITHIGMLR
jgi:signal peptidase I